MHECFGNQLAKERRCCKELLVEKEQQFEVRCQKYEEGLQRKLRAHEEFHDKELQDQKIIIKRLETSYKNLKDTQIQNSSYSCFIKKEKEENVLQQILSYKKIILEAQSILVFQFSRLRRFVNLVF